MIRDEDTWPIIEAFFSKHGVVSHQLETYNFFINHGISNVIDKNSIVEVQKTVMNDDGEEKTKSYIVEFTNVYVLSPSHREINEKVRPVYPAECIRRDMSYTAQVCVDVKTTTPRGISNEYKRITIGEIPVMVGSCLCNTSSLDRQQLIELGENIHDKGGYFIVKGSKKVINSQQQTSSNEVLVFCTKKRGYFQVYSEVRSIHASGGRNVVSQVGISRGFWSQFIELNLPYVDDTAYIPIGVAFWALGASSKEEIKELVCPDGDADMIAFLTTSLEQSNAYTDQMDALAHIGFLRGKKKKNSSYEIYDYEGRVEWAQGIINDNLFPHLGNAPESIPVKLVFLAHMTRLLLEVYYGKRNVYDRDHYKNKRMDVTGNIFKNLLTQAFKSLNKEVCRAIESCMQRDDVSPLNMQSAFNPQIITKTFHSALTSNKWPGRGNAQVSISQTHSPLNAMGGIASRRVFVTQISTDGGRVEGPRQQHSSHYGVVCPAETPEGKQVGLQVSASVTSLISLGSNPNVIVELIKSLDNYTSYDEYFELFLKLKNGELFVPSFKYPGEWIEESPGVLDVMNLVDGDTMVFVNGKICGCSSDPKAFVKTFVEMRRRGKISQEVSICFVEEENQVDIWTDHGRFYRPLLVVEDGKLALTSKVIEDIKSGKMDEYPGGAWGYLITNGIIDWMDKSEERSSYISMYPSEVGKKHTHCELHPSMMFGIGASLIPFPDHNQSPRNAYQAAMGKQAIGVPGNNYLLKCKGAIHTLNYPEKPIVKTKMSTILGFDDQPAGQNAIVFVMPYRGYGQEDSLVFNASSVRGGLGSITSFITFSGVAKQEKKEKYELPTRETCSDFKGNFSKLDPETFIIREGEIVKKGDVLIGMTVEVAQRDSRIKPKKNISVNYTENLDGVVHRVIDEIDGNGYRHIRVVIAQVRLSVCGDKFSARHGQKGTIGKMFPRDQMPYMSDGTRPDIILNPLALPSRMTIGMMIEMLLGRLVSSTAKVNTVTPKGEVGRDSEDDPFTDFEYSDIDGDATPCRKNFSLDGIISEMERLGYDGHGYEDVYDGITHQKMKEKIFVGVCYYQKLKHLVHNKIHARNQGPCTSLTRQPVEGRKKKGGFRIGSMERDCIFAQGATQFAIDRLMKNSDETSMWFCKGCGFQAHVVYDSMGIVARMSCHHCDNSSISEVKIPYAMKLGMQEMAGMNVVMKLNT